MYELYTVAREELVVARGRSCGESPLETGGSSRDTTVNCSASDLSGNAVAGSFTVTVHTASPSAQLTSLSSSLAGVGGGSFSSQLNQAIAQLAAGQTQAACNDLTAFANHVKAQSGKQLTTAQANALLAQIAQIKSAIGC